MSKQRALELLEIYGDHRYKCCVQKKINGHASYVNEPYQPCDCGWREVLDFELRTGRSM